MGVDLVVVGGNMNAKQYVEGMAEFFYFFGNGKTHISSKIKIAPILQSVFEGRTSIFPYGHPNLWIFRSWSMLWEWTLWEED